MATYRPHDKFFMKARAKGLPSRAAFKLEELLGRFRLAAPGARVVDLGCAPGGWLAILSRAVGPCGLVIGVDLAACDVAFPNVRVLGDDIRDARLYKTIRRALGGRADLVTSDLAPKLSGVAVRDQARLAELLEAALGLARDLLKPNGAMVAKVFMGPEFDQIVARFTRRFGRVEVARTRASRPGSSELYLVARDFRAARSQTAHQG